MIVEHHLMDGRRIAAKAACLCGMTLHMNTVYMNLTTITVMHRIFDGQSCRK
jgi:hypothetical protein